MICVYCGANNSAAAAVCRNCGAKMTRQEAAPARVPPPRTPQPSSRPPTWQPAPPQSPQPQSPAWQSVPQRPFPSSARQLAPQQPSQPLPRQLSQSSTWQTSRNSAPLAPDVSSTPVMPSTPSTPARQPARTRTARPSTGRYGLFIVAIGVVLIALVVGSVVFFLNHSFAASGNPASQTLTTYCNALKSGDYQTAYAQLASSMKSQLKESDFAYSWQAEKVSSCTVDGNSTGAASCTSTSCPGSITFFYSNGSSSTDQYQLIQENGQWKIQSQTSSS